jgi:uncharacterized protein YbaP (TraB family)
MRASPSCLSLVALVAFVGCRAGEPPRAPVVPAGSAAPVVEPTVADDPWAPPAGDPLPSLAERKQLVDEACPSVTAPYFFRIEKAGKVSHILGTRHISVSLAKFPPTVHDALGAAKLVVFEVAPGDESNLAATPVDLKTTLGATTWKHFELLVGAQLARAVVHAPPAAALVSLMVMYEDPTAQLEKDIEVAISSQKTPTRGLETAAFQDAVLARLLDVRMLRATIDTTEDREELADNSRKDLAEYCAGTSDAGGMEPEDRAEMLAAGYSKAELDQFDEELVYSRNADWIPKLEPLLRAGDAFIAVGAGHLQGPRSVIAMLAARGYKTTRLK